MTRIRKIIGMTAIMGALAIGLASPADASGLKQVKFTWRGYLSAGYCSIEPGATWTLYSNGTAKLDATVSSLGDDDAWLMWAHLLDKRNALLGDIRVYGSTSTKFVKDLHNRRSYRWIASGQFDPDLFDLVEHMSLSKHC